MATRPIEIAQRLVTLGYDVTILASNFNNYTLANLRPLGWRLWRTELIGGVSMVWIRTPPYRSNGLDRILNMVVFALLAIPAGLIRRPRPDIVVGVTNHPLGAFAGWVLSRLRGARFFFEVTDLWPEALIQYGRLKRNGMPARLLRRLERFLFDRAERIIMLWRDTGPYVEATGADARKIVWIPHGVELQRYADVRRYDGRIYGPFRIMFVGGFNASNCIGTMVEAAAILLERGWKDIELLLVGTGLEKQTWVRRVAQRGLTNIKFIPPVPKTELPRVLSDADAFVYGLRDIELYNFGITLNKLFDYLAAGRPIIFFGRSSYDPVALAKAGYVVRPDDPSALADAFIRMAGEPAESRVAMGERGRKFLATHHLIPNLAVQYDALFGCEGRRGRQE
jgi:glycosyltransferase involved in cell wall biosynthesis